MNRKKYLSRINELHIDEKRYIYNGVKTDLIVRNDGYVYLTNKNRSKVSYIKVRYASTGYLVIEKVINGIKISKFLHIIVAETFIPNNDPINKVEVNHIDGNKLNNNVYNLEWVTPKENIQHAIATGLRHGNDSITYTYVNSKMNISNDDLITICELLQNTNIPIYNIANEVNVDINLIRGILHGDVYTDISKKYNFSNRLVSNELSSDDVKKICQTLSTTTIPIDEIARDFNIDPMIVYDICIGAEYNHISVLYNMSERFKIANPTMVGIVHNICKQLSSTDMSITEIAEWNGVSYNVVYNIYKGNSWTDISQHYNFSHNDICTTDILDNTTVKNICTDLQDTILSISEIAHKYNVEPKEVSSIYKHEIFDDISKEFDFSHRNRNSIDSRYILNEDQVHEICKLLQNTDMNYNEIAEKFGVRHWVIKSIRCGEAWTDISKEYNFDHRRQQVNTDKDTVIKICELLQNTDIPMQEIADKFGIRKNVVMSIKCGFSYTDISKNYDFSHRDIKTKITEKDALEICKLLKEGHGREYISKKLGVTESNVRAVKEKRQYTEISDLFGI